MDHSEPFHRHSLRLKDFDYSQAGAYFVTICTKNRQCLFGNIQQGVMQLNAFGRVASAQWQQLPNRFKYLELGEWIVMPNHIHGILIITGRGEAYMGKGEASLKIEHVDTDLFLPDASPLQPNNPSSAGALTLRFLPRLPGKKERDRTGNCCVKRVEPAILGEADQVVALFPHQVA